MPVSKVREDVLQGAVHAVPLHQARGGGQAGGVCVRGLRGQLPGQGEDGEAHQQAARRAPGVSVLCQVSLGEPCS